MFKRLNAPADDDDDLDPEELRQREQSRSFFEPRSKKKPAISRDAGKDAPRRGTPKRVSSAPNPVYESTSRTKNTPANILSEGSKVNALLNDKAQETNETIVPDSTRAQPKTLQRSETTPLPALKRLLSNPTESPSRAIGPKRRKRGSDPVERPEGEQIFKDLFFYYIPDDDIAPARRIRINKAREYGAAWTRIISAATHIIVDKALQWKDVDKVLARANKAQPPKVVNEDYPIDCILFRAMLDSGQRKYQLVGQPIAQPEVQTSEAPPSSEESTKSLQLKAPQNNPKRWDYVPPNGTPSRSEESTQGSRVARTPASEGSQQAAPDSGPVVASPIEEAQLPPPTRSADNRKGDAASSKSIGEEASDDELSKYIDMMQEYKDLPLDADDEDDAKSTIDLTETPSDSEHAGSDEELKRKEKPKKKSNRKHIRYEERFACNTATAKDDPSKKDDPNARTIEVLQQMASYYDRIDDHWRTLGYRKAIATLKRQDVKITTEEEAFRLPAIGSRLAQKIEEIVTTDRLKRLEYAKSEPMNQSLQLFLQIYGVGNHQAQQWLAQGLRTLDDLKTKAKLSENQRVWIDHHDDLITRIPRREVEALGNVVKRAAQKIDSGVELIIGGSHRRGAKDSGDIDFIVTKPGTESSGDLVPFLNNLISRLEEASFLVARLASSRSGNDGSKWHGCCVLPPTKGINVNSAKQYKPVWRRVDFLLVPETEMGAALIYFTGNDIFNRSMRLLASRKGMRLNQRGLYKDVLRGPGREKFLEGELLEGRDEKRIFEILGVRWREPRQRWC